MKKKRKNEHLGTLCTKGHREPLFAQAIIAEVDVFFVFVFLQPRPALLRLFSS
jgi:hypothetical protein